MNRKRRLRRPHSERGFVVTVKNRSTRIGKNGLLAQGSKIYKRLATHQKVLIVQQCHENEEDAFAMRLFLDFAAKDLDANPSNLEFYTEEMSAEDDELIAGVVIDD